MIRVLFVCLGNICRSPMAEAVFRHLVKEEQLADKIEVDSAGTASWHIGKLPHQGTRDILKRHQISDEGIKARQVTQRDWEDFHYIIVMDDQNMNDLKTNFAMKDQVIVKKLLDFVPQADVANVPDPYYTGDFEETYILVYSGCQALLTHIRMKHDI